MKPPRLRPKRSLPDDGEFDESSPVVLALVERAGSASAREIRDLASAEIGYFWAMQHTHFPSQPQRLAALGYLVDRNGGDPRRARYALTERGREALERWRAEPTSERPVVRDDALLRIFFGADSHRIALAQHKARSERLAQYEELVAAYPADGPPGPREVLELSIEFERAAVEVWERRLGGAR